MSRDNWLTTVAANMVRIPFQLRLRKPFERPSKILILKPCCLSQVLLATPLLETLSKAYPDAQIDWAVSPWARAAIAGNQKIGRLIDTGSVTYAKGSRAEINLLIDRLKVEEYDTCFIPSRSALLSYIAWQAGIGQRIGLDIGGRGFAHTLPVKTPRGTKHEALLYLALAEAVGIEVVNNTRFEPNDAERRLATNLLADEIGWFGDSPLVVIHPGGGDNPVRSDSNRRWPEDRFALLASRLIRKHNATVVIVGGETDRKLSETVNGIIASSTPNLTGRLTLGEVGAICEIANLFVGNDAGPTHVAAAVGCPTLAIFGSTNPEVSAPFTLKGEVAVLRPDKKRWPFSWKDVCTVDEAESIAKWQLNNGNGTGTS